MAGREIEKLFKKIQKSDEFENIECFSCVLLSCGGSDESGNNFVFGSDGIFYSIEIIIKKDCENKDLLGVPKLFILLLKKCAREAFKAAGNTATENDERNVWGSKSANTFTYYLVLEDGKLFLFDNLYPCWF